MSESNLELVRHANTAFNDGELGEWAEFFDPEVVYEDRNNGPGQAPVLHGLLALRRLVEEWRETMADFRVDIDELVAIEDAVVTKVTYRGTGKGSQLAIEFPMVDVSWWSGGRINYYLSGLESLEEGRRAVEEDLRVRAT